MIIELGFDFVAGISLAPMVFLSEILAQWIAALNHEALHNTMERCAIIETLPGKGFKILDGFGGGIRPKLDHHVPFGGFHYGDFIGTRRCLLFLLLLRLISGAGNETEEQAQDTKP